LKISEIFHFGTTPYYISLINPNDENDPILKQILPDIKEIDENIKKELFWTHF
jgi:Lysine 2,3-aminomutase